MEDGSQFVESRQGWQDPSRGSPIAITHFLKFGYWQSASDEQLEQIPRRHIGVVLVARQSAFVRH